MSQNRASGGILRKCWQTIRSHRKLRTRGVVCVNSSWPTYFYFRWRNVKKR